MSFDVMVVLLLAGLPFIFKRYFQFSSTLQMMRFFVWMAGLFTVGTILSSCDPCRNLDCATDNFDGQFRIVSAADDRDLVFGAHPVYDKNNIRFYSLKGTDTTFFDYKATRFPDVGYDSILYVHFFPKTDVVYMWLSNGDVDTLDLSFRTSRSKCCGVITEITNFRYNNSVDISGSQGTQKIRK